MSNERWPDWKIGAQIIGEEAEGVVMTIVEDPSTIDYLHALAARQSALEQVADAAREVVNDGTSRTALARLAATVEALDAQEAKNA